MRKVFLCFCLIGILFSIQILAQQDSLHNRKQWIVGTWVNTIDKTPNGKEYAGINCRDTLQYKKDATYISKQCAWDEDGNWRFNEDNSKIVHYNINCDYWEKVLGIKELGKSHREIISLTETEMIILVYSESEGEVWQYYTKLD